MINSATQYPVHSLLSHDSNTLYRVPVYQREYSWNKQQWEELFDDLMESEGSHFLGTIICLNSTVDSLDANVLELIDGQQRMTTITLLMAAVHSILSENKTSLDEDSVADLTNLRRQLVRKKDGDLRLRPQRQGHNLEDYKFVMKTAGLPSKASRVNYFPLRKVSRCYEHFRREILDFATSEGLSDHAAAQKTLAAVNQAIIVKIEVQNHADAFVLFESLNNRGMPLTPVDLVKNHLLAESERRGTMSIDLVFDQWSDMLSKLGDNYANHERFLRHYYNAFKHKLPSVPNATIATRSKLIRIYETLIESDVEAFLNGVVPASEIYGRITGDNSRSSSLDTYLTKLGRAQGAPSYVLLLFLMSEDEQHESDGNETMEIAKLLIDFFVRRNLTGSPQTYALPRIFMDIIDQISTAGRGSALSITADTLRRQSVSDETFLEHLRGPVYETNSDVTRFLLTSIAEEGITKETAQDLWAREKNHYIWTIEHILPQGANLPAAWKEMMGGAEMAAKAQAEHVHKLGNLTITGYNSSLGNKSFSEKKDRTDSKGNSIGYRNNLALNRDIVDELNWTVDQIEERTARLAQRAVSLFPL